MNNLTLTKPLTTEAAALVAVALDGARDCFHFDGEVKPVLLAKGFAGKVATIGIENITDETKPLLSAEIQRMLKDSHVVIFCTEAWLTFISKEKQPSLYNSILAGDGAAVVIPPRDNPFRCETVMVQCYEHGGRVVVYRANISGDNRKLGEWEVAADSEDVERRIIKIKL